VTDRSYRFALALLAACGSSTAGQSETTPTSGTQATGGGQPGKPARVHREEPRHAEIAAKHQKLELAQQDAMAATCSDAEKWAAQHCMPSCYPSEPKDPRAGTKLAGRVELQHRVCQRASGGEDAPWMILELPGDELVARAHRGRPPKAHKKGSWQADVASAFAKTRPGKGPRGEVFAVGGDARSVTHPVTKERLRCVTVTQFTTVPRGEIDACGVAESGAPVTCEAAGSAAARGVNLARFRLAEAAQLRDAVKDEACRTAALDALATARGLPRWRQWAKLNTGVWKDGMAYKTRFDGILDEDALFALAPALEQEALQMLAACNLVGTPPTKPEQEHAFHSCP
jgi:hypothetical protein